MGGGLARQMGYLGVLAMDSRCRLCKWFRESFQRNADFYGCCSPLRSSSFQSVRMDFLAASPGVPSIDTLTLTDIETGFAMNLR